MLSISSIFNPKETEMSTVTVTEFIEFIDNIDPNAQNHRPEDSEIQEGLVDFYGKSFNTIIRICCRKNNIVLLQGRRGSGKSFLLRRLVTEIQKHQHKSSHQGQNWLGVLLSFQAGSIKTDSEELFAVLLSAKLLQNIRDELAERRHGERPRLPSGEEDLIEMMIQYIMGESQPSFEQTANSLKEQFPGKEGEKDRQRIDQFMQKIKNLPYLWGEIAQMLEEEKIERIHFFIDEFTESYPEPSFHNAFFKLLRVLRTTLANRKISTNVITAVYPSVTSFTEFTPGEDGEIIDLPYRGSYGEWHDLLADKMLFQRFNIYLQQEYDVEIFWSEYINLRNQFFDGVAIRRLSYLSYPNPRDYITMLRKCAEDSPAKVTLQLIEKVAQQKQNEQIQRISHSAQRFPLLKACPKRTNQLIQELMSLFQYACNRQVMEAKPKTVQLRWEPASLLEIRNELEVLNFIGIIEYHQTLDDATIKLNLLYALPKLIGDGDVLHLGGPFSVRMDELAYHQPTFYQMLNLGHQKLPLNFPPPHHLPSEPDKRTTDIHSQSEPEQPILPSAQTGELIWEVEQFYEMSVTDNRLEYTKEIAKLIKDAKINQLRLRDIVYYSSRKKCFVAFDTVLNHKLRQEIKSALEGALSYFIQHKGIIVQVSLYSPDEVLNRSIDELDVSSSIKQKLQKSQIKTIRQLLHQRQDRYIFHQQQVTRCKLNRRHLSQLSTEVKHYLQRHDMD
jgi:energy-coupling factor transporter ATP-binding protein EcfA2